MKGQRGGWAQSNEHIAKNAPALSPELRDLLDRIFVGEEEDRITIQVRACACIGSALGVGAGALGAHLGEAETRCGRGYLHATYRPTPPTSNSLTSPNNNDRCKPNQLK